MRMRLTAQEVVGRGELGRRNIRKNKSLRSRVRAEQHCIESTDAKEGWSESAVEAPHSLVPDNLADAILDATVHG
jgi:hypothetical protein